MILTRGILILRSQCDSQAKIKVPKANIDSSTYISQGVEYPMCAGSDVNLCPDYAASCGNDMKPGGKVGDLCSIPCADFDGVPWCPTGSDHSGNANTPWGWCVQNAMSSGCSQGSGCSVYSVKLFPVHRGVHRIPYPPINLPMRSRTNGVPDHPAEIKRKLL